MLLYTAWKFSKWMICGFISALIMVIMMMFGVVPIPWVLAGLGKINYGVLSSHVHA